MVVQKIRKAYPQMEKAMAYYKVISALNALYLSEREVQLLAFMAIRGSITNPAAREDFCKMFNTSPATINNLISKLKRLKVLVKEGGKTKVNPAICPDFTTSVVLYIKMETDAV